MSHDPLNRQNSCRLVYDFETYFQQLTDQRRKTPTDDVASVIANAQIDGAPIPDLETNGYYMIVATAGHDTTIRRCLVACWRC